MAFSIVIFLADSEPPFDFRKWLGNIMQTSTLYMVLTSKHLNGVSIFQKRTSRKTRWSMTGLWRMDLLRKNLKGYVELVVSVMESYESAALLTLIFVLLCILVPDSSPKIITSTSQIQCYMDRIHLCRPREISHIRKVYNVQGNVKSL